jgi:hypothetical protein
MGRTGGTPLVWGIFGGTGRLVVGYPEVIYVKALNINLSEFLFRSVTTHVAIISFAIEAQPVATPAGLFHGNAKTLVVSLVLVPRLNAEDRPQVINSDLTFEGITLFILQSIDEGGDPWFLDGALPLLFGRGRPKLLRQPDACTRGLRPHSALQDVA